MMKKKIIIPLVVLFAIGLLGFNISENYKQLQIREEIYHSEKIDNRSNGFLVGWFSDLYYSSSEDNSRIAQLTSKLDSANPDIIVFTGDLLENPVNSEDKSALIEYFSSLKPAYGKFAVLGDNDCFDSSKKNSTIEILENSGFEIIDNTNKVIALSNSSKINLVGLGNMINGNSNAESAFAGLNSEHFTIVITHCPDSFYELDNVSYDLLLAGHSLGGKVRIPLISYLLSNEGAKRFYSGTIHNNKKVMDITNGVGTPGRKLRFLADPEVVFYSLRSE